MNEGNPTGPAPARTKWWNRSRPEDPRPGDPVRERDGGDFELAAPLPGTGLGSGGVPVAGAEGSTPGDRSDPGLVAGDPAPGSEDSAVEAGQVATRASLADGAESGGGPADRLKPLHDPDPYSTPPYGEPGPWALAPPVQHPATTLGHGVELPAPTPVPTPAPATGAVAPEVPVPGAPGPAEAPYPGPWRRYDPWAQGHGPLQQSGAVVASVQQRHKRARRSLVGGALALALVSGFAGGVIGTYLEREGGLGDVRLPQAAKAPAGRAPGSVAGIAARALPSVVTLHVTGGSRQGTGTGFVLDDRGHILTNNHVVESAASSGEISVTFSSGDTAKAKIVGRDSGYDLAVVKVTGVHGLTPLPLGNSDNVRVGDPVVAIGAPFDLANTVTSGIISAKERPITAGGERADGSDVSYVDALQTDAPINPGNSGGPLLDSQAHVVGINSAIRSADSGSGQEDPEQGQAGSIGLGFAIPVNQARRVAEELINNGRATHPVIGIHLDISYTGDGARIDSKATEGGPAVVRGGPGDRAGLKPGDVITEVDGQRVHSGQELIVKTRAHRPGDRLRLTVDRDGEEKTVVLVLGSSDDI